jgi:chromosome segregation ATPase
MARNVRTLGFLAVLICASALAGCKDKQKEEALAEAEQARVSLTKVKGDLARTRRELADLKEELAAVKENRDELHTQVEQLIEERGGAIAAAEKTQETVRDLTTQSTQQAQNVEALQNEIKQLRALVESQQAIVTEKQTLIDELQKTIEQLQAGAGEQATEGQGKAVEPNEPSPP